MKNIAKATLTAFLAVVVMLAVLSLMGADSMTGITRYYYFPTQFALASYTSTQTASSVGIDLGMYGTAQIQVVPMVTSTQATSATLQFSNSPLACSSASVPWTTATSYTVTSTSTGDLREVQTLGRCFRIQIGSTSPIFTPTVYMRVLNRN